VIKRLEANPDILTVHFSVLWTARLSTRFLRRAQKARDILHISGKKIPRSNSPIYSIIDATTPAPTVLPPSRIAKRNFSSMAIGTIKLTSIVTLSPGITISTPSGKRHNARHVRRAEVKLWTVIGEERRMTSAFFLRQNIGFRLKLRMRLHGAGLAR